MENCNCEAAGREGYEHEVTCPVFAPPLSYEELRQVRALLAAPSTQATIEYSREG